MPLHITSFQNPKVKQLIALRDRRERKKTDCFLIEGYRELLRAFQGKLQLQTLYISPEHFLGENEPELIENIRSQGVAIISLEKEVFSKISYRDRPDGLLAVAKKMNTPLSYLEKGLLKKEWALFLIAESIEKPGNLGTILRSADAVGCDGVIVCDPCTDIYNPNVVRASVGTLFTLPVVEVESNEALAWLKKQQIKIVAAMPSAKDIFTEVSLKGPLAIAVGTEQTGLSELWMQQADLQVKIPMLGIADSLNVATATTLLLYETLRQKNVAYP